MEWIFVGASIMSYLLGSISPSYFLGRLLRGIDIREHGDGNAGTVNAFHVLGIGPAIITALFDVFKGIGAIVIGRQLGLPEPLAYACGLFAILGHNFPFYLQFRGGQGAATATGMLLMYLFPILKNGWVPLGYFLVLPLVVATFAYIARKGEVVGIFVLPLLLYLVLSNAPLNPLTLYFALMGVYLVGVNLYNIVRKGVFRLKPETRANIKWWRFILRPFALAFPIFHQFYGERFVLTLIGAISLLFIIVDSVRLMHGGINFMIFKNLYMLFKQKESTRVSSITMFLIACFITILIFPKDIATMAIVFLIVGDMSGKFFGLQYGRVPIFHKTLEGSLAFWISCVMAGTVLLGHVDLSASVIMIGAIAATLSELLPLAVDDNFSISILSASAMFVTRVF